jgi:hypothetical protein
MNSKLKRLEEIEKLLPEQPCGHPGFICIGADIGPRVADPAKLIREMENCPYCQKRPGPRGFDLSASARLQHS